MRSPPPDDRPGSFKGGLDPAVPLAYAQRDGLEPGSRLHIGRLNNSIGWPASQCGCTVPANIRKSCAMHSRVFAADTKSEDIALRRPANFSDSVLNVVSGFVPQCLIGAEFTQQRSHF